MQMLWLFTATVCKVSSVPVHSLRRSCAYMTLGQMDELGDSLIPPPPPNNFVCAGIISDEK